MKRLSRETRDLIRKLSRKRTLSKIAATLGLSKSVAYYWFRKAKGRTYPQVNFNPGLNSELGELIGIFASDGSYVFTKGGAYQITIALSFYQVDYAEKVSRYVKTVFGKGTNIYPYKRERMILVRFYGKRIIEVFRDYIWWKDHKKTYTVRLRYPLAHYHIDFLKGFVRGLFLGDGWASKSNTGFASVCRELTMSFSEMLNRFKVGHSLRVWKKEGRKPLYRITIFKGEKSKFFEKFNVEKNAPAEI